MPGIADVRSGTASIDGPDGRRRTDVDGDHTISYVEYGDPQGQPLVFLHGTPGSALLGAVFRDHARRTATRVIAIDRPGYGRSSSWPTRSLTDTGAFVTAVMDDAGASEAGLVGFSGGGPHALAVAATHPDRVRDLHVVGGVVPPSLRQRTPIVQRTLSGMAERLPTLVKGLFRAQAWIAVRGPSSFVVAQYTNGDREEIPEQVAEIVRRDFVTAFATQRSGAVHELRMLNGSWASVLDDVDQPVRLWHGDGDTNVPVENARNLADRLSDAELEVFDDADHLSSLLRSRAPILEWE
ncbi:MAG: pimeloyl-ACP methyl ester carboxylesterase [Halobacteriales archaeon]|jgi:pimeloyl-ACP methyl ester carboxylesterase